MHPREAEGTEISIVTGGPRRSHHSGHPSVKRGCDPDTGDWKNSQASMSGRMLVNVPVQVTPRLDKNRKYLEMQ